MYRRMKSLWNRCVVRREDHNCASWPDGCESCVLVIMRLVNLPKRWELANMDTDSMDDKMQLSMLIHSHITGRCGSSCLFCEVERIPL
jgi:hypothetical protein